MTHRILAIGLIGSAALVPWTSAHGQTNNLSDVTGVLVPEQAPVVGIAGVPDLLPLRTPPVMAALCVADVRWHANAVARSGNAESLVEALVLDHRTTEVVPVLTDIFTSAGAPRAPVNELLSNMRGLLIGTVAPEALTSSVMAFNTLVREAPDPFIAEPPAPFHEIHELLGDLAAATRDAADNQPVEGLPEAYETIDVRDRVYVRTGGRRQFDHYDLVRVGQHQGLPVLALTEEADRPVTVFMPVQDGCDLAFQPFERVGQPMLACVVDPTAANGIAEVQAYRREDGELVVLRDGVRVPAAMLAENVRVAPEMRWYIEGRPLELGVPGTARALAFVPVGDVQTPPTESLYFLGTLEQLPVFTRRELIGGAADAWDTLRRRADGEIPAILDGRPEFAPLLERLDALYVPIRPDGCLFQPLHRMPEVLKGADPVMNVPDSYGDPPPLGEPIPGASPRQPVARSPRPRSAPASTRLASTSATPQPARPAATAAMEPVEVPAEHSKADHGPALYTVQVASYTDRDSARELERTLEEQGAPVWIDQSEVEGRTYYRVRIGALSDPAEAERLGERVRTTFDWPVWIARIDSTDSVPDGAEQATRTYLVFGT